MADATIPAGPWSRDPELWDTVSLDGQDMPGYAGVTITRANKWDDKKAKGTSLATHNFAGVEPAKVTITLAFWTGAQFDEIVKRFQDGLDPIPTGAKDPPKSHAISHAVCIARKVSLVIIESIAGPERSDFDIRTFTITCTEASPPKPANTGKAGDGGPHGQVVGGQDCGILLYNYNNELAQAAQDRQDAYNILHSPDNIFPFGYDDLIASAAGHDAVAASWKQQMQQLDCNNMAPSQSPKKTGP